MDERRDGIRLEIAVVHPSMPENRWTPLNRMSSLEDPAGVRGLAVQRQRRKDARSLRCGREHATPNAAARSVTVDEQILADSSGRGIQRMRGGLR